FATADTNSVALRLAPNRFEDQFHRRLFEVGQVHGDLRLISISKQDTHGFYVAKATAGKSNALCDVFRNAEVGGIQIDVVRDERLSSADHSRAGCRMNSWLAEVPFPVGIWLYLIAQAFELPTPDIFQIHAFRSRSCGLVEVHRHFATTGDFAPCMFCDFHTFCERHTADGNERDHVSRSNTWMLTPMPGQVDVPH